jgi:hypothetical protein
MIQKIPGGWITVLVGGAVVIYLLGKDTNNPTLQSLSDGTVGQGTRIAPGGFLGFLGLLATAGAFLNKETVGKFT